MSLYCTTGSLWMKRQRSTCLPPHSLNIEEWFLSSFSPLSQRQGSSGPSIQPLDLNTFILLSLKKELLFLKHLVCFPTFCLRNLFQVRKCVNTVIFSETCLVQEGELSELDNAEVVSLIFVTIITLWHMYRLYFLDSQLQTSDSWNIRRKKVCNMDRNIQMYFFANCKLILQQWKENDEVLNCSVSFYDRALG